MEGTSPPENNNVVAWFTEFQWNLILKNGIIPEWFHGIISRKTSEEMLLTKPVGYFLIRVSESRTGYTLSYRAEDRCRHFMIDALSDNQYVIVGENRRHQSLHDLVAYHRRFPIIPFTELLTVACGQISKDSTDYAELMFTKARPPPPGLEPYPSNSPQPLQPHQFHPNSKGNTPPPLPVRNLSPEPAVSSPKVRNVSAPGTNPAPRLYPCLETELGALPLQNTVNPARPVPKPHLQCSASSVPMGAPPQIPARSCVTPKKDQSPSRVDRQQRPVQPCTDKTVSSSGTHCEDQGNLQPRKQDMKSSAVTGLINLKKKFHKKTNLSEEHTYAEISGEGDTSRPGAAAVEGRATNTENEYQEIPGEKPVAESQRKFSPDVIVNGQGKGTSLPMEYLQPPPYAPGYCGN
ncbi:hematopoietic SH2 domain-containing protein homolog [Chanos chanos]|uniref:Hematopoietic SH2 domain-containing protein homolog n=1 Tax=Chanos chanos TaxID=29144 RepID=A0A6J2W3I5_CHACN|nr:hematopoietic SH2 domain-containing protein homolog [Chanos chanos]